MSDDASAAGGGTGAGWRAVGLFLLATATAVSPATVLVAVPLLVLVGLTGVRAVTVALVSALAMIVTVAGARDGVWYAERGWALTVGGIFAALSLALPRWRLPARSLAAVAGAAAASAVVLALQVDAWASIDWAVADRIRASFATWVRTMESLPGGSAGPAATAAALFAASEVLVHLFPAMLALESMAALGVAWWIYVRLYESRSDGLGPFGRFGFNDHLVWVMIVGLVLVALRPTEGVARLGANLAVFMGALYGLRGLAVVAFVSGGLTFFGYSMLALGFLIAAPVVVSFSVLLGIADTWLDMRTRYESLAA